MAIETSEAIRVPFYRYSHVFEHQREQLLAAMLRVLERGAFILQREVGEFEAELAQNVGARHAIGVANGTDALIIGLRAADVNPGDEVILPSHTYVASAASVHFVGAIPVLVDCASDHLLDPAAVEAAVTSRTRALMPVHLNGRTCDMDALQRIASLHHLVIVEDAAQGLGSRYKGRCAGTFGAVAGFSFYPAKMLGCFGDGGAVVTNHDDIARRIRQLRDHGRNEAGDVETWGLNSRLDTLQAAVLSVKLSQFRHEVERRRRIAALYREVLEDLEDITLPPGPNDDPDHFDVYQNYEVEAVHRDELRTHLTNHGVTTVIQWGGRAVHQIPGLPFGRTHLPRTDALFERCFLLPMNSSLTDDEVSYIGDAIRKFYGR